jgi:hypothetical protein
MDVQELIENTWTDLGDPSDLDPYTSGTFDITTDGAVEMLRWLNRAYKRISNWKFPNGKLVRFKVFETDLLFKMPKGTGTVTTGDTTTITLATVSGLSGSSILTTANYLKDWVIELTGGTGDGQKRTIYSQSDAGVCTVAPSWTTAPDSTTTVSLYKRFMRFGRTGDTGLDDDLTLDPVSTIDTPLKLLDVTDELPLQPGGRTQAYQLDYLNKGIPRQWIWYGNGITFDRPTDDEHWYRFEYYSMPQDLTAATDVPLIPTYFHEAIGLFMMNVGLKRDQEFSSAYSVKRDLQEFMRDARNQSDLEFDREDAGMVIRF